MWQLLGGSFKIRQSAQVSQLTAEIPCLSQQVFHITIRLMDERWSLNVMHKWFLSYYIESVGKLLLHIYANRMHKWVRTDECVCVCICVLKYSAEALMEEKPWLMMKMKNVSSELLLCVCIWMNMCSLKPKQVPPSWAIRISMGFKHVPADD